MKIAAFVGASLTLVLVMRRWTMGLIGSGILNQELFAGGEIFGSLIDQAEQLVDRAGKEAHAAPRRRSASSTPTGGDRDGSA